MDETLSCQPVSKPDDENRRLLEQLEEGLRRHIMIRHMPIEDFLQIFLPPSPSPCPTRLHDVFNNVVGASPETAMCPQFIKSISRFAPDMELVDNHKHKCDVGGFAPQPDPSLATKGACSKETINDLTKVEIWVDFKGSARDGAFVDDDNDNLTACDSERETPVAFFSFKADTAKMQHMRGRLTAYALAQLESPFLQFAFSVLIRGNDAHLIRWERAGVVVTRTFDYIKNSGLLGEFFWRCSHLLPDQRGMDFSVGTPIFEYKVPDGEGTSSYSGPRLPCPSLSLIGRSTCAFPVYNLEPKRSVYPKDTVTETPALGDYSRLREPLTDYICYRIALGVVGWKLSTFESTKELVQGLFDAFTGEFALILVRFVLSRCDKAHRTAYDVAKILHRDISPGNIILADDGRGLLIDWDMSDSRKGRLGTQQFISGALLLDHEKHHDLEDDLESFVHVLAWSIVHYVPNAIAPERRQVYLTMLRASGGYLKARHFKNRPDVPGFDLECPRTLLELLTSLSDVFAYRYGGEYPMKTRWQNKNVVEPICYAPENGQRKYLPMSQWFFNSFERSLASPYIGQGK